MTTVYDPNGAVGLGVPWSVLQVASFDATLSSVSSRSLIPGAPVADQASDALPMTLGEWESPPAGGAGFVLRVQAGGNVGPAGATWGWRDSSEPDTSLRGQDWPTRPRRMWSAGARAGETGGASDMVTLPSGRVVTVYASRTGAGYDEIRVLWMEADTVAGGTAADEIVVLSEDPADPTWQGWELVDTSGRPTIAHWEEEGRLIIAVRYLSASGTVGQVALFESTDDGESWALRNPRALATPWVSAARSAYDNLILRRCGGSWWLLDGYTVSPGVRWVAQWAGTTPDYLELLEATELPALIPADGVIDLQAASDGDGILVVGVGNDYGGGTGPVDIFAWRLGSAYQPISESERVALSDNLPYSIPGRYPAVVIDPDGTYWAVMTDEDREYIYLVRSTDRGESWHPAGYHPLELGAGATIRYLSATHYRGGLLVMFGADNGAGWVSGADLRHYLVALGGWDNQPLPYVPLPDGINARLGYGRRYDVFSWGVGDSDCLSWFPPALLTATTPAGALTGAAPVTTIPDGSDPYLDFIDAGAGSYVQFVPSAATFDTTGIILEADGRLVTAGTSVAADNKILYVRLPNDAGGDAVAVSVGLSAGAVVLRDEVAGTAIATIAIAGTTRREYRLAVYGSSTVRVSLLYRIPGEQVWTQVTGTTSKSGSGATRLVRSGAITSAGQTVRVYRLEFVGTIGLPGPHDPTRALAVGSVLGRPASADGVPVTLGLKVAWRRGPLHPGDTWSITASAEYPPEAVGPREYPSPSDRWQSSTDGVQQDFVWTPAAGQLWRPPGALFFLAVLYADGIDQLVLSGRDSAGAYQDLITANLGSGSMALRYSAPSGGGVTGGSLRPDTTGDTASRPWRENELAGGWIRSTASGAAYRITGNSPGLWGPSAHLKPTLYVADWDDTEASAGLLDIYPPGSVHISAEQDPGAAYDRIRLRIPATADTVEGRYTLKVVIGSVFLPGRRYSYGRNPAVEPIARGVETAGGRVFYDPNQPLQRSVRFAWADPFGTRDYYGYASATGPNALLLASGGTQAQSFVSSTHKELEGILRLLGGPGRPLLYLSRVEAQLTAWSTTDPDRWLWGRIKGALTTPRPWGDEGVREEVTVSELLMVEEV